MHLCFHTRYLPGKKFRCYLLPPKDFHFYLGICDPENDTNISKTVYPKGFVIIQMLQISFLIFFGKQQQLILQKNYKQRKQCNIYFPSITCFILSLNKEVSVASWCPNTKTIQNCLLF